MSSTTTEVAGPAETRLSLLAEGWRTLDTATDPRRGVADEGAEITIGYFPDFAELGVGNQMFLPGRVEESRAVYTEVYRRSKHSWIPD